MEVEEVGYDDFAEITNLQPDGWDDIIPKFQFYIDSGLLVFDMISESKIMDGNSLLKA